MKRTGEVAMSIIGAVFNLFLVAGGAILISVFNNEEVKEQIRNELAKDPEMNATNMSMVFDTLSTSGWTIVIASLIALILGIVAAILLKGNKKPKLAGALLLVATLINAIFTLIIGWLSALLYVIAGIMCFARKPRHFEQ